MTLADDIAAIQGRLTISQDAIIDESGGTARIIRAENDAQWEAIKLLAERLDNVT